MRIYLSLYGYGHDCRHPSSTSATVKLRSIYTHSAPCDQFFHLPTMPSGRRRRLDFQPFRTSYLFSLTTVSAITAWFVALVGQSFTEAHRSHSVGVLWFAILLQGALNVGFILAVATDAIAVHRLQLSIFGAIAIVFAVNGVQVGIFSATAAPVAMSVGWLILAMVDIIWVLFFTSTEDSVFSELFNMLGTGGLTSPSMNGDSGAHEPHSPESGVYDGKVGYPPALRAITQRTAPTEKTIISPVSANTTVAAHPDRPSTASRSSLDRGTQQPEGASPITHTGTLASAPATGAALSDIPSNPSSPSRDVEHALPRHRPKDSPATNNEVQIQEENAAVVSEGPAADVDVETTPQWKAKALHAYTASPQDSAELSFRKGEILEIEDRLGKWWQARKADGTAGIVPSNYLQIID
ncbi:hypothetical protein C8J57DRAFT_1274891 [Mycena rebaudengoi]|nr:hypothetical protein C8J57DRAFT_1274891 [Mycena rebaudengoi]